MPNIFIKLKLLRRPFHWSAFSRCAREPPSRRARLDSERVPSPTNQQCKGADDKNKEKRQNTAGLKVADFSGNPLPPFEKIAKKTL
jgi:hypothetical protein